MQFASYVAVSGQVALARRLEVVANNVANAQTAGFRAEGIAFESLVSSVSRLPVSFALETGPHALERGGSLVRTGNPLDFAIQGEGFFALQTPEGVAYTRDGRMQVMAGGELVSLNGHAVLDAGGAPIVTDPTAGVAVSRDGMISQNGRQIGAVGLFHIDLTGPYRRYENSAFIPEKPGEPIVSFEEDGIITGFTESSNVNPVMELANLIKITRAFEALSSALDQSDGALKNAIQALGARS